MFSEFMSMTFSVDMFTVFIYVSMYLFVYLYTYLCASDDKEHQWYYFRMDLCLLIMFVFVSMYVCMYVFYFLQFMVISIILTRVFYFMCL